MQIGLGIAALKFSGAPSGYALPIVAALLVLIILLAAWLIWRYLRRRTAPERQPLRSALDIWRRFLAQQPAAARPILGRYPWVVVLGETGAGKTRIIKAKAELEEYQRLGFPSYEDEELLQIYLSRRAIIHEVSSTLLSTAAAKHDLLAGLWRRLCRVRPPLVVIMLSLEQLQRSEPRQLSDLADRLKKKLETLSAYCNGPVLTRICLTDAESLLGKPPPGDARALGREQPPSRLDAGLGLEPLAAVLRELGLPLSLKLDGYLRSGKARPEPTESVEPGELTLAGTSGVAIPSLELRAPTSRPPGRIAARFLKYAAQLKYALPKLPGDDFDQIARCLASSPQTLLPFETLLSELTHFQGDAGAEAMPASSILELDQLYIMSRRPDRQLGNPLYMPGKKPPPLTRALHSRGLRGLWATLRSSRVLSSRHAVVCAVLVLLALGFDLLVYQSHSEAVEQLHTAGNEFQTAVFDAQRAEGLLSDSAAVIRAAYKTGQRLRTVKDAERYWPLLSRAFAIKKARSHRQFLALIRRAFLIPRNEDRRLVDSGGNALNLNRLGDISSVEVDVNAEAAMARILYQLAAIHISPDNTLGELATKHGPQWAEALAMPERTLANYVSFSEPECGGRRTSGGRSQRSSSTSGGTTLFSNPLRWLEFASSIQAITDRKPPSLNLTELKVRKKEAELLQSGLQLIRRSRWLTEIADALEEECYVDVRAPLGPLGWALRPPPWLVQNLDALDAVVTLVLASDLELPKHDLAMAELADLLLALSPQKRSANLPDHVHSIELPVDPKHTQNRRIVKISEQKWREALASARREQLLEQLKKNPLEKRPAPVPAKKPGARPVAQLFSHSAPHPGPPRSPAPSGADGMCGAPQASSGLSGQHSRVAFERDIRPTILGADKALAAAGMSVGDQARVVNGMLEWMRRYAVGYRENLQAHFTSYGVRADSLASLRATVGEMLVPDSAFLAHLRFVADNANLGELQGPYLQPFVENLAPFRPLVKLATPKDGAYPELEPYRAILAQLASALDSAYSPDASLDTPLRDALTGLGRLGLSMLAEEESSPLFQTQRWLDKAGVAPELRGPFLAPMRRALCLGRAELERSLETRWRAVREALVRPLYLRFPFDRNATEDVPVALLDAIHPKDGALWRFVQNDLATLATVQADGNVVPKRLPGGALKLPADLVPTLSHLGRLSRKLWDPKDGARRPLELKIQPQPLGGTVGRYAVIRAYLSVGGAAAVGYNQMPGERALAVTWWNQENASVGIDLSTPDSPARQHASIDETRSTWSLLRLLKRGTFTAGHVATFLIPVELPEARGNVEVRFLFMDNPFAAFLPPKDAVMGVR